MQQCKNFIVCLLSKCSICKRSIKIFIRYACKYDMYSKLRFTDLEDPRFRLGQKPIHLFQYSLTFGAECCRSYKAQIFAKKLMQSNSFLFALEFIFVSSFFILGRVLRHFCNVLLYNNGNLKQNIAEKSQDEKTRYKIGPLDSSQS